MLARCTQFDSQGEYRSGDTQCHSRTLSNAWKQEPAWAGWASTCTAARRVGGLRPALESAMRDHELGFQTVPQSRGMTSLPPLARDARLASTEAGKEGLRHARP